MLVIDQGTVYRLRRGIWLRVLRQIIVGLDPGAIINRDGTRLGPAVQVADLTAEEARALLDREERQS